MSNESSPKLPPFPSPYRASGLLLHVTSLPSPYGIGDVGPAAIAWIDQLCDAGQSWWQALPLGPTGYGNSPYQALSSFAGNGLLISPDWLIEDGLLRSSDCAGFSSSRTTVDYDAIIQFKHRLLEKARTNFTKARSAELSITFEQFCHEQADWLEDYALFRALKIRYNGAYYLEWPTELIQRVPKALAQVRRELANQIDQVRFAQFLLFRQGERLKKHAKAKGVRLIGDLPFLFLRTRVTFGQTRTYSYWTTNEGRSFWQAYPQIISARRVSSGVIRSTTGMCCDKLAIDGASIVCALCLRTWM
jgi:4-alpha-glucanotransferase